MLTEQFLTPDMLSWTKVTGLYPQIESILENIKKSYYDSKKGAKMILALVEFELEKNPLNTMNFEHFRSLVEQGDYIQVYGQLDYSKSGEPSLFVEEYKILTKALRPLPEKMEYDNTESRYLDKVADYKMNTRDENGLSVRDVVRMKSKYWEIWRDEMTKEGFLSVECPIFESIPGGAEAKPFTTFYNELDQEMYLRISLELPLKKLIAGGFEKVYEIGRIFRNEGSSPQHLQEYTQIEWYCAYRDYDWAASFVKRVYQRVVLELLETMIQVDYNGNQINWGEWCSRAEAKKNNWELIGMDGQENPEIGWPKINYFDAVRYFSGGVIDTENKTEQELCDMGKQFDLDMTVDLGLATLLDKLWKKARVNTHNPFFLCLPPVALEPLAKRDPKNPELTQRWQVVAGGAELGKAFSELNDPIDQFGRFEDQQKARDAGNEEAQFMDTNYVKAMEYGMPPMAGFGTSERFVSFLLGKHIRECVTFPHIRENQNSKESKSQKIKYLQEQITKYTIELGELGVNLDVKNSPLNMLTQSEQVGIKISNNKNISPNKFDTTQQENLPQTELLCLDNTYLFNCCAKVLEIGELDGKEFVILDKTVFYPQGGGQASDTGVILTESTGFAVSKCQIIEDKCYHFGEYVSDELKIGDTVEVNIDAKKRRLHARIHTAGHILDIALTECGYKLEPTKGYHFPEGPYVEYTGKIESTPELITNLETTLAQIIAQNSKVTYSYGDGTHTNGKPNRILHIQNHPDCPCGGTHVQNLSEIGTIKIKKIKNNNSKGTVQISYSIE